MRHLLTLALSFAGSLLVYLINSPEGVQRSPDSHFYLGVADQLVAGHGLIDQYGDTLLVWPPGYPVVLALTSLATQRDAWHAAGPVQALLFAAIIILSAVVLRRSLGPGPLMWAGLASVVVFPPLVMVSAWAWSEPLFIVWVLAWLCALLAYRDSGRRSVLAAAALLAALAFLTRYAGVVLIACGIAVILLARWPTRWRDALTYGLGAIAVPAAWLARNWFVSGTFTGPRDSSPFGLAQNVTATAYTMVTWFTPCTPSLALGLLVLVGILSLAVWRLAGQAAVIADLRRHAALTVYMLGYVAFLVACSTAVHYDPIGTRLLAPVAVPAIVLLLLLARRFVRALPGQLQRGATWLLAVPGALILGWHFQAAVRLIAA